MHQGQETPTPKIDLDATGKVHGKPLPKADDIPEKDIDDAIDSLDQSIGKREKEQVDARARGQNTSSDPKERQKYRAHQDRLTEEKKLKEDLERRKQQAEDRRAREEASRNSWPRNRNY
jgi:hypothetical protein